MISPNEWIESDRNKKKRKKDGIQGLCWGINLP